MSTKIDDQEVDVVIAALRPDLNAFFEAWRAILSRFHLIIVKEPNITEELQIPSGFNYNIYTKSEIEQVTQNNILNFNGPSCRYFGYLVSCKKYVISIDDDCLPAKDNYGEYVDPVVQHMFNLQMPATPFFFNTLYDPYRKGADFVRGYPFSLRTGTECVLSCGLWLNVPDYDPITHSKKPRERNTRYVDAVITVPLKSLFPVSGINIGFNREVIGPALFPGLRFQGVGERGDSVEDIWCGMCAKVICDHLGFGVKTGLPYVWRSEVEDVRRNRTATDSVDMEWQGVKLMGEIVSFFRSVALPKTAVTVADCILVIAGMIREKLGTQNEIYLQAADAMEEWVKIWKACDSRGA